MTALFRIAATAFFTLSMLLTAVSHANDLTISVAFGPDAEVPDPRAGYNGWLSNQSGVTETLMGIDYDLNCLLYTSPSPRDS